VPKRVMIGVPSTNIVHADMAFGLINLIVYTFLKQIEVATVNRKGSLISQNRCALVDAAREIKATHLLFIDSDHLVPRELLVRLLAHDKDIVGIHQPTKLMPCRSNVEDLKAQRLTKGGVGLEEVSRCGTGIMLINMKVFDAMKRPYFNTKYETNRFAKVQGWVGEDFLFCEEARHKGFKIYVDHTLSDECFHIGQYGYSVKNLEAQNG